jgi:hypothetical protein
MTRRTPTRRRRTRQYECAPRTAWCVEGDGIVLVNRTSGAVRRLGYPQAAVWDLAARGQSFRRIASTLRAVASLGETDAVRLIHSCVRSWVEAGFLREAQGRG